MATYFVDPVSGNNSNAGTSFAARWLTVVGKTLAADDVIKYIASPDPVDTTLTALFTDLGNTLTLSASPIAVIANCDTAWTASANVTATVNTTPGIYMEGTGAANLAIAAGFTTGKVAYFDLGASTDFSAYQQISFYMQGTSASFSSVNWQIKLCSDTAGATAVNTFTLPVGIQQSCMHAVTIDNGSSLGSNIRSIALYALADPGAVTVRLDHFIACKAPSDPTALTLTSMVGKNTAGDIFYPILSFAGTTLNIGGGLTVAAGSGGLLGYVGTTETVALYRREVLTIPTNGSATTSSIGLLTNSGTDGHPITFSGGWNRTDMSTQTGETWISANSVNDIGFRGTSTNWLTFEKFAFVRFIAGWYFTSSNNITITAPQTVGNFGYGIFFDGTSTKNTITDHHSSLDTNYGEILVSNSTSSNAIINGTRSAGIVFNGIGNVVNTLHATKNESFAVDFDRSANNIIYDLTTRAGLSAAISNFSGVNYLVRASIAESTEVTSTAYGNGRVFSHTHDLTAGNYLTYSDLGLISSDATTREKPTGIAWRMDVTSANATAAYPMQLGALARSDSIKIACISGKLITVSARVMRSNTGIALNMVVPGGQIAGVPTDVVASASAAGTTYETITLTFTPTADGVVDVVFQAYGGTTFSAYIDKMASIISAI